MTLICAPSCGELPPGFVLRERLERARLALPKAQLQQANLTTQQATQESQGRVSETEMLWQQLVPS